jgi:ABC-type cobalt transport system substrate-binding protein
MMIRMKMIIMMMIMMMMIVVMRIMMIIMINGDADYNEAEKINEIDN